MGYPKSEDKKIQKLTNLLIKHAENENVEFSFGGEELYLVETFSDFGGLPMFLAEAKEIYEKIYNNLFTTQELMDGIGRKIKEPSIEELIKEQDFLEKQPLTHIFPIDFIKKESDTFFGFVPKTIDGNTGDFALIAHFSHYSLDEYIKLYKRNKMLLVDGKIPLDPLYEKMVNKINNKKLIIRLDKPELSKEN
jgi:hypothetical protein